MIRALMKTIKGLIRLVIKLAIYLIIFAVVMSVLGYFFLLDETPTVAIKPSVALNDIRRAQALYRQYQPNKLQPGKRYIVPLTSKEIDLVFALLAAQSGSLVDSNLKFKMAENGIDRKSVV